MALADTIQNIEQLEDLLSEPTPEVVLTLRHLEGDLIVLGVAGKMGPSLARMARRASDLAGVRRRIIGVARFSSAGFEAELQRHGVETIRCDLLDEKALQRLPDAANVLYLAGMKFGATGQESLTWALNTHLPALVCRKFAHSRIVAFSTGNVYGFVPASSGGARETDPPAPLGEYAMSCLGRERIFEHFSRTLGLPVALIRLNYACDLRYGVLVDLARKVLLGAQVDLSMGWFNTLWQGDANAMTLRCFAHVASPPLTLNLTGPECLNVRKTCQRLGQLLGREPVFMGKEAPTALLSNAGQAFSLFGQPRVSADRLVAWVAAWLR
ncbi:MAG: NAD-dependent epimerase/dehydratase family protein, partial [Verrucomicrobia bacterium]|nr:NAD-dependent epimerase/dehydratase family protein [Verrucomicrobiota bacterium]